MLKKGDIAYKVVKDNKSMIITGRFALDYSDQRIVKSKYGIFLFDDLQAAKDWLGFSITSNKIKKVKLLENAREVYYRIGCVQESCSSVNITQEIKIFRQQLNQSITKREFYEDGRIPPYGTILCNKIKVIGEI